MNKKTLKKQAQKARRELREQSKPFFDELKKNNYPPKEKPNFKLRGIIFAIAGTAFSATLILVLCLVLIMPQFIDSPTPGTPTIPVEPVDPPPEKKHYLLENEEVEIIDVFELELEFIVVNFLEGYEYSIYHAYDKVYNDTLYYWIDIVDENNFESLTIYFYVNPDYENRKNIVEVIGNMTINDLPIRYNEIIDDDDGIYMFQYNSITELDDIMIYIKYEQITLDEESNFFNFFEQSLEKA